MEITFYDRKGEPVAYTSNGTDVYLFSGKPVAYLDGTSVYSFDGTHLGWFLSGWIRDHDGNCVLFTNVSQGGPMKPLKQLKPLKSLKSLKPLKGLKQLKPVRSLNTNNWSRFSPTAFFDQ